MDAAELADLLRRHAARHSVPGAAVGVLREGVTTIACYGVADRASARAVTPETRFRLGSLTKSMVAMLLAELAAASRLSFDDHVVDHVPELQASRWARDVTVRDLMANRSGLPLRAALEFDFAGRAAHDGTLAQLVADLPADEECGPAWSYSNVGWCVLGRVIETVTGEPWHEAMLHMAAGFGLHETRFRASAHAPAGTRATSTVSDLVRLAALNLDRPELAILREVHADIAIHAWLDAWCLGWARFDWAGVPVWGWDGVIDDQRSILRLLPDRRAAVVLLTNAETGRAMYRSLFAELSQPALAVTFPRLNLESRTHAAGDLARFEGVYAWPDRRFVVRATATSLRITTEQGTKEAFPMDDRTFLLDAADPDVPTMTFGSFDEDGRPGVLYDMLWALPRVVA
jgi:CubicO group peptidase (beta-lactamase class C family)